MSRRVKFVLGAGVLTFALGVGWIALYDSLQYRERFTYKPVIRPSALSSWKADWEGKDRDDEPCESLPEKWMVFCWDGASWDVILPLIQEGKMPHLASLMQSGTYGNLYSFRPTLSPVQWTTMVTGVSPVRHGILDFDKDPSPLRRRIEKIFGLKMKVRELYSNADRRVKALWNLLTEAGKRTLVVGYHNTYPAEEINGLMVSNYLAQQHRKHFHRIKESANTEFYRSVIYPNEFLDEVFAMRSLVAETIPEEIARFANIYEDEVRTLLTKDITVDTGDATRPYLLAQTYLIDAFHASIADRFLPRIQPDVLLLHLQGIDTVEHYFFYFYKPALFDVMHWSKDVYDSLDAEVPRYAHTIEAYYRYMDEWLGKFLETKDARTAVLVISDHGSEPEHNPKRTGHHQGAPPGIFVMNGPGIRKGQRLEKVSLYDVLPTLMASLNLPVSRDLDGRILEEAFCPQAWNEDTIVYVDTYGKGERYLPRVALPPDMEKQIREHLKALGYIQ